MSSPLGWFRRHQKGMMVVFGMVLMAIFGLGSVAMMINPSQLSNPIANKVAIKWDGGQLKQSQVDNLRVRHYAAGRFIAGIQRESAARSETYRPVALPIQFLPDSLDSREADFMIAQRYITAERAKQEGIRVNDAMVNDYISLVHNLIDMSPAELEQINSEVNGSFVDLVEIREQLKIELAAQQYTFMLNTGMPRTPTPTEAMEYYSKLEKTIECSVMPLKVEDYVDKVTEKPTNAELKAIFEEGQYKLADPDGLKPGFKRAKRVKINYLVANYDDFLTAEKLKITDEQVQEEYKRLVADEDPLVMELIPPTEGPDVDAPTPPGDDAPGPPADGDDAPLPPADDQTEESASSAEESSAEEANAEESKEDEKSEEGDGDELPLTIAGTQSTFVSLQDQDEKKKEEAKSEATSEEAQQGAEENSDPEIQTESAEQDSSDTKQGDAAPPMLEDENELPDDIASPGDQDDPLANPLAQRPMELDEKLSDLIRERMVGDQAIRARQRVIAEAEADVRDQQYEYSEWSTLSDAEKEKTDPNITLDLKEMADRLRLQYGETDLMNYNQLVKDAGFGSRIARVEVMTQFGQPRRSTAPFANLVFSDIDKRMVFEPGDPVVELGTEANILWWPVEIKDMEIRTFSEAKDDVIAFWKLEKARELARADAVRIAGELNSNGKTLMDYSDAAQNTGSFTWYLSGLVKPQGVTNPGDDFMETAFGLELNKCGGALNDTKDVAYVIQKVIEDSRTDKEINDSLLENWSKFQMVPPNVARTVDEETREVLGETQRTVARDLNVDWVAE